MDGITAVGYQHRRLRELGGGWQLLETAGWDDPPVLTETTAMLAERWNAPVLVAFVADTCAQVHGAAPGVRLWSSHLPDPAELEDDCGMLHRPRVEPGGSIERLKRDVREWAMAAGLPLSPERLDLALSWREADPDGIHYDADGNHFPSRDRILELVRAFGFRSLPPPRRYVLDPFDYPIAGVTGSFGMAYRAKSAAVYRAHGERDDEEPAWESAALALERDVYASLYGGPHSPAELVARAREVRRLHDEVLPPRLTGVQAVLADISDSSVAGQVASLHSDEDDADLPDGTGWHDGDAGPGRWPDAD